MWKRRHSGLPQKLGMTGPWLAKDDCRVFCFAQEGPRETARNERKRNMKRKSADTILQPSLNLLLAETVVEDKVDG